MTTDATAIQVWESADFQCEVVTAHGRCARSASGEMHHVRYRSRGGGDDHANLVLLCPFHHERLHAENWTIVWGDDGALDHWLSPHGKVEVWRNVSGNWEQQAQLFDDACRAACAVIGQKSIQLAHLLGEMEARNIFSLLGYDDGKTYAEELGIQGKTYYGLMNTGRFLASLPKETAEEWKQINYSIVRDNLPRLRGLEAEELEETRLEILDAMDHDVPAPAIKEMLGGESPQGDRYKVRLRIKGEAEIEVGAADEEAARAKAETHIRSYKVFNQGAGWVEIQKVTIQ